MPAVARRRREPLSRLFDHFAHGGKPETAARSANEGGGIRNVAPRFVSLVITRVDASSREDMRARHERDGMTTLDETDLRAAASVANSATDAGALTRNVVHNNSVDRRRERSAPTAHLLLRAHRVTRTSCD